HVARVIEPVRSEGALIVFGDVVVAADGVRAPRKKFTRLTRRNIVSEGIDDAELVVRRGWSTLRLDDFLIRIVEPRVVQQTFRHAEHLLQLTAKGWPNPASGFGIQLGAADLQHSQAGQVKGGPLWRFHPADREGWYQSDVGDTLL